MQEYDKFSKWLIQHHGDSIPRLAGVRGIVSWRALQAELVQPRRLPDGLIEVTLEGERNPDIFVLELGSCPEAVERPGRPRRGSGLSRSRHIAGVADARSSSQGPLARGV
jgi:hypothetical protein